MANRRTSFGMVALVVTMAIVLLLVAKSWRQLASSASQAGVLEGSSPPGSAAARQQGIDTNTLPRLRDAEAATDVHAADVGQALAATQE